MFGLGGATRIYLAVGSTDLRKGFDGLYGLVGSRLESDPNTGHLFVFCNRYRTRIKALHFDGSGLCIFSKRLCKGRFRWPQQEGANRVSITAEELSMLLAGMDPAATQRRKWWRSELAGA